MPWMLHSLWQMLHCVNYCVVPENIHTPTTEGIGNSGGVGGSKAQENPEERGGELINYFPEGQLRFGVRQMQTCRIVDL